MSHNATPTSTPTAHDSEHEMTRFRFSKRAAWLLLGILVIRVLSAILIAPPVVADAQGYSESALRIMATQTFAYPLYSDELWETGGGGDLVFREDNRALFWSARPNAYTMPGYPVFLAGVWSVARPSADPDLPIRIMQALLSVGVAALVYLIGLRVDERTAFAALVLAALYPPFTLANSYLTVGVLYQFLLTAGVFALLLWLDRRTWRTALVLGFACLLVITPWLARNYARYGALVPFGTSAKVNVVQGIWQDFNDRLRPAWAADAPPAYSPVEQHIAEEAQGVFEAAPRDYATSDAALLDYYSRAAADMASRDLAGCAGRHPVRAELDRARHPDRPGAAGRIPT